MSARERAETAILAVLRRPHRAAFSLLTSDIVDGVEQAGLRVVDARVAVTFERAEFLRMSVMTELPALDVSLGRAIDAVRLDAPGPAARLIDPDYYLHDDKSQRDLVEVVRNALGAFR